MSFAILGSSFAVISAAVGSLAGGGAGALRDLLNWYPIPKTNTQGMTIRLQNFSLWLGVRLGGWGGSGGAAPPERRRSTGPRRGPSHVNCRFAAVWPPGFMPAYTIDSRNSRMRFMVAPPTGLSTG